MNRQPDEAISYGMYRAMVEQRDEARDKTRALEFAGDALATGLAAFLRPDHDLIRLWDEANQR